MRANVNSFYVKCDIFHNKVCKICACQTMSYENRLFFSGV
jgi:hypothetical protein